MKNTLASPSLRTLSLLLALLLLLPALAAAEAVAEAETAASLKQVEAKFVCMVNDALFAKEQIPVPVGDQTYYGCCDMCKQRLAQDQAVREAIDPISGATVDKAKAVIGASEDGTIYYFESEETFKKYGQQAEG